MQHVHPPLGLVVHGTVLLDRFVGDFLTGLSPLADRLHFEFHLERMLAATHHVLE